MIQCHLRCYVLQIEGRVGVVVCYRYKDALVSLIEGRVGVVVCYRYKDALVSLATELLHKLLFRYNQSQLEELDDDDVDDDVMNLNTYL